MSSLYKRISSQRVDIPAKYDLKCEQLEDIKNNAPGIFEMMCICFKFGYLQGLRAERTKNS